MKSKISWEDVLVLLLASILTLLIMWLLDVHGLTQKLYEFVW